MFWAHHQNKPIFYRFFTNILIYKKKHPGNVVIFKRMKLNRLGMWLNFISRGPNVKVGHYTQMIWADTDTLGCAVASYTSPNPRSAIKQEPTKQFHPVYGEIIILPAKINKKWHHLLLVCNYSPGGNYLGAPLYDQGLPCSGCPKDKPCSRYSSMCGDRSDVRTTYDNFTPFFRFWRLI